MPGEKDDKKYTAKGQLSTRWKCPKCGFENHEVGDIIGMQSLCGSCVTSVYIERDKDD